MVEALTYLGGGRKMPCESQSARNVNVRLGNLASILLKEDSRLKVITMKTCKEIEANLGLGGLPPTKFLRSHPLECQKTPFCKIGRKLFSSLIFMLRRKSASLT